MKNVDANRKVNVKVNVLCTEEIEIVGAGKKMQKVIVGDGSGCGKVTLWQVNCHSEAEFDRKLPPAEFKRKSCVVGS